MSRQTGVQDYLISNRKYLLIKIIEHLATLIHVKRAISTADGPGILPAGNSNLGRDEAGSYSREWRLLLALQFLEAFLFPGNLLILKFR